MIRKNFLMNHYLKSNPMFDECHFYFIIFGSTQENMEGNKAGISISRQLLSLVLLITVVQPIIEIDAKRNPLFQIEECQPEGKVCEDFDGMYPKEGTRFTTSLIASCLHEPEKVSLWCSKREDKECITSQCMTKFGSKQIEKCPVVNNKDGNAEKNYTLNAYQESCSSTEEKIVCCQPDSVETALLAGYGAEAHEFPHQAFLVIRNNNPDRSASYKLSTCGGTIYNEKYILTAAHCVVDSYDHPSSGPNESWKKKRRYSKAMEPYQIEVVVGTNLPISARPTNRYKVEKIIVHPQFSSLEENEEKAIKNYENPNVFQYDVALLEIKETIKFNAYTKALKVAPPNFGPQDYAENVVIVGWGTTDNLNTTEYLQKANLKIRDEDNKWACKRRFGFLSDQHLCLGGIIDSLEYGKTAGGGDSGGPAICRDEHGFGVHCGITSYGGNDTACSLMPSNETCWPTVYADVSHFRPWIIQEAGAQERGNTQFHIDSLYGINAGDEMAQVKIFSGDGKTCGGSLVSADVVVTASNCIFDENNESKAIIVEFGSNEYYVDSVQLITPPGNYQRGVVNQKFYNKWIKKSSERGRNLLLPLPIEEPYYNWNIGVIRLSSKVVGARPVTLSTLKLVEDEGTVYEAAWMRDSTLGLRKFPSRVISNENCKGRYDRIAREYTSFPIGLLDVCMVEKYSGGNICDRELGGGVFCGGPNGRTLCGVQVFRMCDFSTPKIIADMYYYGHRIKEIINNI